MRQGIIDQLMTLEGPHLRFFFQMSLNHEI